MAHALTATRPRARYNVGASVAVFLTALIGLWCTFAGYGPISLMEGSLQQKIYAFQLFTATVGFELGPIFFCSVESSDVTTSFRPRPDW